MKKRILFLSHSASRNGASILLLHFLQWMRQHTDYELEVVCVGGGELTDEYRKVARTRVLRNPAKVLDGLPFAWAARLRTRTESLLFKLLLLRSRYDLVYANTAATWRQVAALPDRSVPLIWHIHEMPYALQLLLGDHRPSQTLLSSCRFVAVSQSVVNALVEHLSVASDDIDLVRGFVVEHALARPERLAARRRVLASLGWPPNTYVVGGCGVLDWRKGADLFLQVAAHCRQQVLAGSIRFLWVGSEPNGVEALRFAHDLKALNLEDICLHIPSTAHVRDYYCAMDVFALTSREDPYPLVMLEAGMQGVPTICFAGAGGGPEFVEEDAGIVVPYLDLSAFAEAVQALRACPERRNRMGAAAHRKVCLAHSVKQQAQKLLLSIERGLVGAGEPQRRCVTEKANVEAASL